MEPNPSHDSMFYCWLYESPSVVTHYSLSIGNVHLRLSSCSWLRYDVLCLVPVLGGKVNTCLFKHQQLKDL